MSHLICRFAPPSPRGEGVVLLARLVTPFKLTAPAIVIRRGVNEAENNPADCFLRAVVPKARSVRRAARRGNHRTGRRPLQRNGIILSTKPRQQVLSGARRCVHPRGVPLTLPAPANAVRRAQASAGSSFAIRSCIYIQREVANGERKTKIQIKRRNPFAFPRAGFNLKCNLLCDEFAQSRKRNRIFNNLFLFSVLCRIRTSSHTIFSCFTL